MKRAAIVRVGNKNTWLEIVLDEGKNRHIRRLLAGFSIGILRLIRIAIGPVALGDLPKGKTMSEPGPSARIHHPQKYAAR